MEHERCPTCRAVLPPVRTCANEACGKAFYRSENGRTGAAYCSGKCAGAARVRRWRARHGKAVAP